MNHPPTSRCSTLPVYFLASMTQTPLGAMAMWSMFPRVPRHLAIVEEGCTRTEAVVQDLGNAFFACCPLRPCLGGLRVVGEELGHLADAAGTPPLFELRLPLRMAAGVFGACERPRQAGVDRS